MGIPIRLIINLMVVEVDPGGGWDVWTKVEEDLPRLEIFLQEEEDEEGKLWEYTNVSMAVSNYEWKVLFISLTVMDESTPKKSSEDIGMWMMQQNWIDQLCY